MKGDFGDRAWGFGGDRTRIKEEEGERIEDEGGMGGGEGKEVGEKLDVYYYIYILKLK